MRTRDLDKLKALELRYRGLAMEDGLWEAAEALARQIGATTKPPRQRKDISQFPFETALGQHVRKIEARYGGILEAAPDAMVVTNALGEIVLVNARAETQFGFERDELLGQKVTAVISGGFIEQLLVAGATSTQGALGEQAAAGIELVGTRKDGSHFPVEVMLSLLESSDGMLVTAAIRNLSLRKSAEKQLVRAEARARGLLEAAPDAMVVVNKRGRIVLVNARAEQVFGYPRDELLGEPAAMIVPGGLPKPTARDAGSEPSAAQTGSLLRLEGLRKDGTKFPIETAIGSLHGPDGLLLTAAIRDVSHCQSQAEDYYRSLLDAAPDAMVVVSPDGAIVLLNVRAERRFGYERGELLGQPITRIVPEGILDRLDGGALGSLEAALAQEIGTGIELTGRRKDDAPFPIELMLSPVQTSTGMLVIATMRDIGVRQAAERHLAALGDQRFRTLLEAAPDAMVISDAQSRILMINAEAERLYGYGHDEMLGQPIANLLPPRFRVAGSTFAAGPANPLRTTPLSRDLELVGLRKDRTEFPIEFNLRPIETPEGTLFFSAIRDITPRRAAEEAIRERDALERRARDLIRSNEDLEQFAYIAAHDLQEPLRMVASYTQLLAKRYRGQLDADADEFIAYAVDGAHRMQLLIADLLAYCRVGTAGNALRQVPSLCALEDALLNLETAIAESGAVITHGDLPEVVADRVQLAQLFQNIVGNAIKYRSTQPLRVHVSAEKQAGEWIFAMSDNGIGIEPQYFEKIFVMFQRLHRREDYSGTGIGLTLCKKIAERHRGRMWVQSAPGEGSTFYLALPDEAAA